MAYVENDAITVLSDEESWELLAQQPIGRLATTIGDDIEMFPVNYVLDGQTVVFRTAQGSKLFELTVNSRVAFEVDSYEDEGGWSIVVHGDAEVLQDVNEIAAVEQLPLRPWVATIKTTYVRIRPHYVSGRRFRFGEEPESWHL
ncbi:pyridoxamine 5'-phosphate oxidase family protein [Raineyella fluvialis]|uniref:Pyridoxamine 5'-phosphate oxidase family protein n=1 Tax=Raineyella fluvialis TaxID=2662261 RepID=A0A5Q2FGJ6_9ACTN|nr:pyridoxamine 5'-phosphate oxidase family protein [Raineyella fluvialis]QGF24917.1 pyridoxamine 5'-phosphate oxidase family protein [Raineyella fluvialis]